MTDHANLFKVLTGGIVFFSVVAIGREVYAAPFKPADWSVFEQESATSHAADIDVGENRSIQRIRVPVTIRGFEKTPVVAMGSAAKDSKSVMIPRKAIHLNLKARADRPNHFYFGDWHLETTPQGKTAAGEFRFRISLAKTFGENHDLEEHIGDIEVSGGLSHAEPGVFTFNGKKASRFRGAGGEVVAELQVNASRGNRSDVGLDRISRLAPLSQ